MHAQVLAITHEAYAAVGQDGVQFLTNLCIAVQIVPREPVQLVLYGLRAG